MQRLQKTILTKCRNFRLATSGAVDIYTSQSKAFVKKIIANASILATIIALPCYAHR